jgi:hypothetical protein
MTKILIFLFITSFNFAYSHDHIPKTKTNFSGHDSFIRLFKTTGNVTFKFDYENGRRYDEHKSSKLEFGAYYRIARSQQIGAFVGELNGQRHTNDWAVKDGEWSWQDTSDRVERFMNLVYIGRYRFSQLDPTLYTLKATYAVNSFNDQNTIIVEPGFHFFNLEKNIPTWSLKASIPFYYAINFDRKELYKKGFYINFLKHFGKNFAIGLNFKYLNETWDLSEDFIKDSPGEKYIAQDVSQTVGLSLICNL